VIVSRIAALSDDFPEQSITIVHGDAPGADKMAAEIAAERGFGVEPHPADWDLYGLKAGPIRNRDMARAGADLCIAFWDGASKGTKSMLLEARRAGITTETIGVYDPREPERFRGGPI
jgi:hypothetical protein